MAQVLVADDDDGVRSLLRLSLELEGHSVVGEAADGGEALQVICECHPDVLGLDMMMPGTDGADVRGARGVGRAMMVPGRDGAGVLRALSDCDSATRPRVVAYSASPTHLELAGELGADDMVLKWGGMRDLLAGVAGA